MASNLAAELARLSPGASKAIIAGIVKNAHFLDGAGINTPIRLRHFFARVCVETGGMRTLEENLNYTAERMHTVWPKRFPTVAAAKPYAKNPEKLANKVYGGRLGNTAPGDGWDYRGSGLLQTTGKGNFEQVGKVTGLPVVDHPEMLRTFPGALQAATIYWTKRKINAFADKNDTNGVCKAVNGGTNGLADQRAWLAKAAKVWPDGAALHLVPQPPAPAPVAPDPIPVVPDPPTKETIEAVQKRLTDLGYNPGGADGKMGPLTRGAILSFKNDAEGLTPNDVIDEAFLTALATASPRKMAPERANASANEIAAKVPEANAHWWNKYLAGGGAGTGALLAVGDAIAPAKGYVDQLRDDVPAWAWFLLFAIFCGGIAYMALRGQKSSDDAYRSGERR